jgi:dihydrofolate synthase/folylpolyglutamate synthase
MVSDRPQIFLDGAHNPDGAVALRRFIEDVLMAQSDHGKIILIFGVLKDKDAGAMIRELIPCSTEVIITSPNTERGLSVEVLREIVEKQGVKPYVTQTISGALSLAHDIASSSDTIMVTGSLYVVGEARALIAARPVSG